MAKIKPIIIWCSRSNSITHSKIERSKLHHRHNSHNRRQYLRNGFFFLSDLCAIHSFTIYNVGNRWIVEKYRILLCFWFYKISFVLFCFLRSRKSSATHNHRTAIEFKGNSSCVRVGLFFVESFFFLEPFFCIELSAFCSRNCTIQVYICENIYI